MDKKKGIIGIFLSCLLLTGCDMIDYHPYDVKSKAKEILITKISRR